MKFSYSEKSIYDCLTLRVSKGEVDFFFDNGEILCADANGHEFLEKDDTLYMFSISYEGKTYTLHEAMRQAIAQYDGIKGDALKELAAEEAMAREISSPYMTGRV